MKYMKALRMQWNTKFFIFIDSLAFTLSAPSSGLIFFNYMAEFVLPYFTNLR